MNGQKLKILVVSFYFPPYNTVGGRRWAKHCKFFVKNGVDVFVVAGNYSGTSPWDKDITSLNKRITRVEHIGNKKPFYQTKLPVGFFEKIKWKLSYLAFENRKKKLQGNYNDPSANNLEKYYESVKDSILKNNINTVIISVGPFSYSSVIIRLKSEFPSVKFVIDYRDYWEDVFPGLTPQQITYEKELQKKVISAVDLIMSPNKEMQLFYSEKFNKASYCLPHCVDPEDIRVSDTQKKATDTISLIYGGAFYAGITENISLIKDLIDLLLKTKKVKAEFYVSIKGYEKEMEHLAIKRFGFIDTKSYFEKVINSDFAVLILPPNRVNAMSSKFYELVALKKPILYFGGAGMVSEFLEKNKLGFHITKDNILQQVKLVLDNLTSNLIPDKNYNIDQHTFDHQTKLLIAELNKI